MHDEYIYIYMYSLIYLFQHSIVLHIIKMLRRIDPQSNRTGNYFSQHLDGHEFPEKNLKINTCLLVSAPRKSKGAKINRSRGSINLVSDLPRRRRPAGVDADKK